MDPISLFFPLVLALVLVAVLLEGGGVRGVAERLNFAAQAGRGVSLRATQAAAKYAGVHSALYAQFYYACVRCCAV
jgi:hypothetical protein